MANDIHLKIAIISDLHCHLSSNNANSRNESYLIVGAKRSPKLRHPVQALIELINQEQLEADTLLCPGDLTDKSCQQGLSQAITHLIEIRDKLKCKNLFCTLGNHDIDSRKLYSNNPFDIPKDIHPEYPFNNSEQLKQYWADGFIIIKDIQDIMYLIINTVAQHYDDVSAKRGIFSASQLENLGKQLSSYNLENGDQIRIALMHHHPILHSYLDYSPDDVLANGDQLMELLSKHKFNLLIHGHRHQPRWQRHISNDNGMLVIASGSFSAMLYDIASTTRNLFHIISLKVESSIFSGKIESWEYNHGFGWSKASRKSARLPFENRFRDIFTKVEPLKLKEFLENNQTMKVDANSIYTAFPDLQYYLPDEIDSISKDLEENYEVGFTLDQYGQIYEMGKIIKGKQNE